MNQNSSSSFFSWKNFVSINQNPTYLFFVILLLTGLAALIFPFLIGPNLWKHQPFHSGIEAAGSFIALFLAPLILIQVHNKDKNPIFVRIASALIGMGILDAIHAFSPISMSFYLSRALGAFIGGTLFASVWLPQKHSKSNLFHKLPWITGLVATTIGIFLLKDPVTDYRFDPGNPADHPLILSLFGIGTLGFLAAAIFFIIYFRKEERTSKTYQVFANFCLLLAAATSISVLSETWGASWWLFHFLRFSAYVVALHYLTSTFRQIFESAVESSRELENRVESRNLQLALANKNLQFEIADRRHSEAELQQTRGQLEAILQAMKDGVLVFDMNAKIIFLNQAEIQAHQTSREEIMEKGLQFYYENYDVLDLNDQPIPKEQTLISKTLRGESFTDIVLNLRRKGTAQSKYIHFSGEPIFDGSGKQILGVFVTREITELINANKALKESEVRFRQMANFLPQMIWETDGNGLITYFNQRWYEYTGFPTAIESTHPAWFSGAHPDDIQSCRDRWLAAFENKTTLQIECRLRRSDGLYYWHLVRALPILDTQGNVTKWLGTNTNIHEQKIMLEQIKENEENLTLITSATGIGIWDWDLQSDQVQISAIYSTMLGLPPGTKSLESDALFNRVLPEDLKIIKQDVQNSLLNREDLSSEFRVRNDDGSVHWLMLRGRPVFDETGKQIRIFGVSMEVTKRKEIEEQLKTAVRQSNEANQLKSAFLANMSHEIRTPLGAILGFTDLLQEPDLKQEEKNYFFEVIFRNGEQLSTLINDILDLSKVEAGQFKVEILNSDFRKILREAIVIHELKAQEKGLHLQYHIEDGFPEIIGTDPMRLKQVLSNIIGNAIKFTEKGFVHVHALKEKHGQIRIQIQDSGIGLSSQEKERLFMPFSQADQTTTRKFGGTGLGLVLSKKLARALGGDLTILSTQPGVGSIFEIRIENYQLSTNNQKYVKTYSENPNVMH